MKIRIAVFLLLLWVLTSVLGYSREAHAAFIASDFFLSVEAEKPFFAPGDVVIFDGILTNRSSQAADFGVNIALAGASTGPEINGQFVLLFPFIEGFHAELFPNQSIPPGGNLRFPFLFIDTGPATPVGTTITSGQGNLLFRNIPPSTHDPLVDFFIPLSNIASATAVPEPDTFFLVGIGLFALLAYGRLREQASLRAHRCRAPVNAGSAGSEAREPLSSIPHRRNGRLESVRRT